MRAWTHETLGQACDKSGGVIRTGPFGSQLHQSDYSEQGIPVVMPRNIIGGRVSTSNIARISKEHIERLSQHKLKVGDIVYGRRGDIGRCALVTERESGWLCGTGCIRIELPIKSLDPSFLFYFLNKPDAIEWIYKQAVGATMPNLNTGILRSILVRYPDLAIQRRIVSILGAYDDLLENNTRRIAILEEMTRRLYEEWFVRFRFPGHGQTRMVDSPLGPVPEGWEVKRLKQVAKINAVSLSPARAPDVIRYVDIASVARGRVAPTQEVAFEAAPSRARRVVRAGDIIWSCVRPNRRSHALLVRPNPNTIVSTGFAVLSALTVPFSFLYSAVTTDAFVDYLTNHATGSAYPAVGQRDFEQAHIIVPSPKLCKAFDEVARPTIELNHILARQNDNLRIQRDMLLPKLVSGEIDVSDAPAAAEVAAA